MECVAWPGLAWTRRYEFDCLRSPSLARSHIDDGHLAYMHTTAPIYRVCVNNYHVTYILYLFKNDHWVLSAMPSSKPVMTALVVGTGDRQENALYCVGAFPVSVRVRVERRRRGRHCLPAKNVPRELRTTRPNVNWKREETILCPDNNSNNNNWQKNLCDILFSIRWRRLDMHRNHI